MRRSWYERIGVVGGSPNDWLVWAFKAPFHGPHLKLNTIWPPPLSLSLSLSLERANKLLNIVTFFYPIVALL
jgi:hypothetical protein